MTAMDSPERTILRSATIIGQHRYALHREALRWSGKGDKCVFVMLNPSTADGREDDPTIRRCWHFAQRERCDRLSVVNLFSYRATDPRVLAEALGAGINIWGNPLNDEFIAEETGSADVVIVAWGSKPWPFMKRRAQQVLELIDSEVYALKITKDGSPGHPLYVRGDAPLLPYDS